MDELKEKNNAMNTLLILVILIPFFKPDIVASFPKINYIFNIWIIISFGIIMITYFKKLRISKLVLLYLLYNIILLFSTLKNKGNVLKLILDLSLNMGIIMAVEIYLKNNKIKLFGVLSFIFYALTILNTISFIMFPKGFAVTEYLKTPIYLLGIDNRFSFMYIPGICIISIYDMMKNKKLTKLTKAYFIITFTTFVYFWSAGALVAESLFIIYYVFIYKLKYKHLTNKYFPVIMVSFVGIVILRVQNIFEFFIVDILHKDLTFSSRTKLWDRTIKIINNNKILGTGIQKSEFTIKSISAYHAHSHFLNIMFQSGILGVGIYIYIVFEAFNRLNKFKESRIAQIVSFTLFVLFIMLTVDTFDITANLFLIICIGFNISRLKEVEE